MRLRKVCWIKPRKKNNQRSTNCWAGHLWSQPVSADGKYRALIYMKPDMSLVMNKHNNDEMTQYTVK